MAKAYSKFLFFYRDSTGTEVVAMGWPIKNALSLNNDPEKQGGDRNMVNVSKAGEVYKCEICGNIVVVKEAGGGELVCCGEPMQLESE